MMRSNDAFTMLIRGIVLIDHALERAIDAYSAIGWKKLDEKLRMLTLAEKAYLAMAMGVIHNGELDCILEVNTLRNNVAHRIDADVTQGQEEALVKKFRSSTKLFKGMAYFPEGYPRTFGFMLFTLGNSIALRRSRPNVKLKYVDDDTNLEHIAASVLTLTLAEVMQTNAEADDDKVNAILKKHTDAAKDMREPVPPNEEAPLPP
jgi:uncharacterized protein YutE (UPF0331/DUF86 family)